MLGDEDWNRIERAVEQAAVGISDELEKMLRELPDKAAPQMVLERLALALIEKQPTLMHWLGSSGDAEAASPLAKLLEDRRLRRDGLFR